MVMIIRARILATVKISWIRVAAFTLTKFTKVNIPKCKEVNNLYAAVRKKKLQLDLLIIRKC